MINKSNLPQELQLEATKPFKELLRFGINHGLDLVQKQGEIIPMVIILADGQHKITVLNTPSKTPDLLAREYIASLVDAIEAYEVLLQGKIPVEGKMCDAIIIFGGERVRGYGHRLAQPYRRNFLGKVNRLIDPVYGGRTEQFIHRA